MNRMPWVIGIVLAFVAGLAIGFGTRTKSDSPARGTQTVSTAQPEAGTGTATVSIETERLQRRVADLEAALAHKTMEADEAKAALAARALPTPTDPAGAAVPEPDLGARLADAKKLFDEVAAVDLQQMYSAENQVKQETIKSALKGAGDAAYEFLEEMLAGEDSGKRFLAVALLGDLDPKKALPLLRKALTDTRDDLVRRMASHMLATKKVEAALPDLARAMKEDKDWGVRVNSAYGAAKMGEAAAIPVLISAYEDSSHSAIERYQVLAGIADVADVSTASLFRGLLETSKDDSTLFLAIGVAQKLKDKASLAPLQAIIQGSGSNLIKEPAKKAYNAIYGQEVYR